MFNVFKSNFLFPLCAMLFCLSLASLTSCSKKQETAVVGDFFSSSIFTALPNDALGFYYLNLSSPAYLAEVKSKTQGVGTANQTWLDNVPTSGDCSPAKVLKETGLLGSDASATFKEVLFSLGRVEKKLTAGVLAQLNGEAAGVISKLKQAFQTSGGTITDSPPTDGISGFEVSCKTSQNNSYKIYVANSGASLAISPDSLESKRLVKQASANPAPGGISGLKSKPAFNRLAAIGTDGRYGFGFIDIKSTIESGLSSDQEIFGKIKGDTHETELEQLKKLPFEAFGTNSSFSGKRSTQFFALLNPQDSTQEEYVKLLESSDNCIKQAATGVSDKGFYSFSISSGAFSLLRKSVTEGLGQAGVSADTWTPFLNGVRCLAMSFYAPAGASPFPALSIALVPSADATTLKDAFKKLIDTQAADSIPLSPWSTKGEGTSQLDFIQSPLFGVGVYLKSGQDLLTASTSEEASNLSGPNKELEKFAQAKGVIFASLIDYSGVANVISAVQGTLSAFTGGESSSQQELIDSLKKAGKTSAHATFNDRLITLTSQSE